MKKKLISYEKKTKILTHSLIQKSIQGKYFNLKKDLTNFDISFIRNSIEIDGYKKFINTGKKFPNKFNLLGNNLVKAKDFEKGTLVFKDFDSEFFWAKCIIQENIEKINIFLKLKEEYSLRFLYGEIEEAEKILDSIEAEFGQSLWLIKNKLSFYQETMGLEKNKSYTSSLKKHLKNGSLAKYIIHWLSIRNESNVSIYRFNNQIEIALSRLTKDSFKEFIIYHLFERENLSPDELIQVLRLSYSFSIIDYYECFVSLLKSICVNSSENSNGSKVKNFLETNVELYDLRLENIALLYDINNESIKDLHNVDIYDKIIAGKINKEIVNNLKSKKNVNLNIIFYCYELLVMCRDEIDFNPDNMLGRILYSLNQIINRGINGCQKEYIYLQKIIINNSSLNWASPIKLILNKENMSPKNHINDLSTDVLNIECIHPLALEFISDSLFLNKYSEKCLEINKNKTSVLYSIALKEARDVICSGENISIYYQQYFNSLVSYLNSRFDDAIQYAKELKKHNKPFFNRKANSLISYSYLKKEDYKSLCEFSVDVYLKDKNQFPFLPLEELAKALIPNSMAWKACEKSIELSIILDICLKHIGKDLNLNKTLTLYKRYAYEDYLRAINKEKPSEIKFTQENKEKLKYYLRFLCQENIMDLSGGFEGGSNEVMEERLKICRLLLDNDSENEEIYKNEISEIVRRQVISSRRKEVDQSRVYVDIKGIKEWAEDELIESYSRYLSYIKVGIGKVSLKNDLSQSTSIIYTPDDEANDLFLSMMEEIRAMYLSSDMGLDRFISTRIRHGELERTIRIPIQKHHLITKKEQKLGPYLQNEYWILKLQNDKVNINRIDSCFKKFSEDFDNLISEIAKEWLQIESAEKPKGLFDFKFQISDVERLRNLIGVNTTIKQFIDFVISILENKLVIVLLNIQEQLNTKGKERAKALLMKLNNEIEDLNEASNMEFSRAINQARIDLGLQFEKIISWFNPSNESSSAPYTIEDAVYVAEAIIKEGESNFSIELHQNDEDNYPIHGQLPSLVDIFINIFDNVVKRSGLENPTIKIQIEKEKIDEAYYKIIMNFTNELGYDIDKLSVSETLSKIKEKMDKNNYIKDVAKEKNSGLIKIFKTINDFSIYDSNMKAEMNFFIKDNAFELNISLPFQLYSFELENQIEEID